MQNGTSREGKSIRAVLASLPYRRLILMSAVAGLVISTGLFVYYYNYYSRIIDRKLSGEVFKNTARIYAAPFRIYQGQRITSEAVIGRLHRAGLEARDGVPSADGMFESQGGRLSVIPAVGSSFRVEFANNSVRRISKLPGGDVGEISLPPELVTNLFDESRQKRRLVKFEELPRHLVNALIAAEDQRFYSHWGIDPIRIVGAMIANFRDSDRLQGGSTITQQLARNIFNTLLPSSDRSLRRKVPEAFVSLLLEQRLTKDEILSLYGNEVYLGQRGSFSVHGFGEAANAYFGKDVSQLSLGEAATLVSIIPAPNVYSPRKSLERAQGRRNLVLGLMFELGTITKQEFDAAKAEDLKLGPVTMDASDAPYLVDYIRSELLRDYSEDQLTNDNLRVYTSLDPDLQRAAVEAVSKGLKEASALIAQRNKGRKKVDPGPPPQAALIALDPRTGEIKAMVGGSEYGSSQYNRITEAFRQPGSIFKPIVYAAAFETAYDDPSDAAPDAAPADETAGAGEPEDQLDPYLKGRNEHVITPVTTLLDEPMTFTYDGTKVYEPNNFHMQYRGVVTVRQALQHSLNIPTIQVAERIGYSRVAQMARRLGLNRNIKAYPSIALGAFEVTPIEMGGAYTAFANEGKLSRPFALSRVATSTGDTLKTYRPQQQEVLRPQIAYLMTRLMEAVINSGTGGGVRARGFALPAAGKTGSSRDGWFAGYTKELLAIAWVGYDDNRDLNLEGGKSALPIWTEFMNRAYKLYPSRNPDGLYFSPPDGIEFASVDPQTGQLATPMCSEPIEEAFIAGSAPASYCHLHPTKLSLLKRLNPLSRVAGFFSTLFR